MEIIFNPSDYCLYRDDNQKVNVLEFLYHILSLLDKTIVDKKIQDKSSLNFGVLGYCIASLEKGIGICDNIIDTVYNYENKQDNINLEFSFAFFDSTLLEVFFDKYKLRVYPELLFILLKKHTIH